TSGLRSLKSQAHVMAFDVTQNRQWIVQTYVPTPVSRACQDLVDKHDEASDQDAIQDGLAGVLARFEPAELGHLSKHLSGHAFDVQPGNPDVKAWLAIKAH